jgi:phage tail-like protein
MARKDPLPAFLFQISITGLSTGSACAFFKSVGGLTYETEPVPLKEGGVNHTTYQLVGGGKWKNITLKRGFTADSEILKWKDDWTKWQAGEGDCPGRKTGTISQLAMDANTVVAQWSFEGGWPAKWELSELDASKSEIAIETLEIAHHGLKRTK